MTRRAQCLLIVLAMLLPADGRRRRRHRARPCRAPLSGRAQQPLQLGGLDLRDLDLSGLDFKGATLAASNLFGSDLSRADLSKADLKGARLDRVTIIGTRFDGADLSDTSFLRPSTFSTLAAPLGEVAELRRCQPEPYAPLRPLQPHQLCRRQPFRRAARAIQQDGLHRAHMAHGDGRAPTCRRPTLPGADSHLHAARLCQPARRQPFRRGAAQGGPVARRSHGCRPHRRRSRRGRPRRRHPHR